MSELYDTDFYAWANEQAKLLREGKLAAADIDHIVEELEILGRTEKRELTSRLVVLLTHLLKWRQQPSLRGNSWRLTIKEQRRALRRHLRDNPSLKASLPEVLADAYGDAVLATARESGLDETTFPESCPWSFAQLVDDDFWPE